MKDYASLRKRNGLHSGIMILVVLLAVLELCSMSVLFSQLASYSPTQKRNVISLTEGSPNGTVRIGQRDESGDFMLAAHTRGSFGPTLLNATGRGQVTRLTDDTGFSVYDENTVWSTHTDVEIFSVSYKNGQAEVTVNSEKGDKVFAPGTEQTYNFTLSNTGKQSLDYILTVEAFYENTDGLWIPIEGRLSRDPGSFVVGSATEWPDILEMDGYREEDVIAAGHIIDYTLDWRWPFERLDGEGLDSNDAYDTMLGNLAVDKDLILHIIIRTEAWLDENPEAPGGNPQTGDAGRIYLWSAVSLVSLGAMGVLIYGLHRDKKRENA